MECLRDWLSGCDKIPDRNMDSEGQAEEVSDRNKLSGKCLPFGYGKLPPCLYHHYTLEGVNLLLYQRLIGERGCNLDSDEALDFVTLS